MIPKLGDYTPSNVGEWKTVWKDEEPHIIPEFGPKHRLSWRCWCHPVLDGDYTDPACSHNVAQ